jgi:propanol-preferring alcohol dehydrogenase
MRLHEVGRPLELESIESPTLAEHQVRLEVLACGVCRTDLHLLDGELPQARYPVVPGHEIVARVLEVGQSVSELRVGQRIGVPWLGWTCGVCAYCKQGLENLCDRARFTGCTLDGGYAERVVADARYCMPIPDRYSDAQAAPLLCAGLIGYRAYRAAGEALNLGLYGFGAAAHLLAQVARSEGQRVFAFVRPGDLEAQRFATELGASWVGGSDEMPPEQLDAAILFAPVGGLVPAALAATRKAGRVICAGIHMSDIPSFPYELLWGERTISSVANLTRADGRAFMQVAAAVDLRPSVETFPLAAANEALARLRAGRLQGAAVLIPPGAEGQTATVGNVQRNAS